MNMAMRSTRSVRVHVASCVATLTWMWTPTHAQWVKVPAAAIPRTPDGKPNLSAPAPRLPDGKPDLSGTWQPNGAGTRPWTVTEEVRLLPDVEPLEFICNENNRDVEFLPGIK